MNDRGLTAEKPKGKDALSSLKLRVATAVMVGLVAVTGIGATNTGGLDVLRALVTPQKIEAKAPDGVGRTLVTENSGPWGFDRVYSDGTKEGGRVEGGHEMPELMVEATELTEEDRMEQVADNVTSILGVNLYLVDGVPVGYRQVDGTIIKLSQAEINEIRTKRETAMASGNSTLALTIRTGPELVNDGRERPEIRQWPGDVVSDQELVAKKVKIVTPDGMELKLKDSAFGPGGFLERLVEGRLGKSLHIVVLPNTMMEIPEDSKYDLYRGLVDSRAGEVKAYRDKESQRLAEVIKQGGQAKLWAEIELATIKQLSNAELLNWMVNNGVAEKQSEPAGMFLSPGAVRARNPNSPLVKEGAIVVFVGWNADGDKGMVVPLVCGSSGEFWAEYGGGIVSSGSRTGVFDGATNLPREHKTDPARAPYQIAETTGDVIVAHEMDHLKKWADGDPKKPHTDEGLVDQGVIDYHEDAGKTFDESDGVDMSKYQFAVRLPNNRVVVF